MFLECTDTDSCLSDSTVFQGLDLLQEVQLGTDEKGALPKGKPAVEGLQPPGSQIQPWLNKCATKHN